MLDLLIISGASRGIGNSILEKCKNISKTIIAIGSSDDIFKINDDKIINLKLDLANYVNIEKTVSFEVSKIKNIKNIGIVLCGAQIGEYGGLLDSDISYWENLYKCNVLGNLAIVKACSNEIKNGAKLKVAFFGGGGAAYAYPDFSGYALSKVATVRAAENLSVELSKYDASVISVAPGAVATSMLDKVIKNGGVVKTKTDISEPTNFIYRFLTDDIFAKKINGRFMHVRDDVDAIEWID